MVHNIFDIDIFDGSGPNGNFIFDTGAFPTKGNVVVVIVDFDPLPIEVAVAG